MTVDGPSRSTADFVSRIRRPWAFGGRSRELETVVDLLGHDEQPAVFLFGAAGVGKTRLAAEVRARCEALDVATLRIVATATTTDVPFAAVAHLLPDHLVTDPGRRTTGDAANEAAFLVATIQKSVREYTTGRMVVFVDDAHLLDSLSATVVSTLITTGSAQVVATVRSGAELHDALNAVLRSGEAQRVDVGAMTDSEINTLVHKALGESIDEASLATFRATAAGNMLYLRELVLGAIETQQLTQFEGSWHLHRAPAPNQRLRDLLGTRLANLSAGDDHAVALLAAGGRLELTLLESLAGDADLADLEARGILVVVEPLAASASRRSSPVPQRDTQVMFAHPLFGEEVLARLPKLRLRAVRIELATALMSRHVDNASDDLRVAVLRLDAGVPGDSTALERGARLARFAHDFAVTARLAGAAFADAPSPALGLLLGESLYETGRFDESVDVLRTSLKATNDQREIVTIGGQLLTALFWGVGDDEAAGRVIDELSDRLSAPECVGALLAHRASIATFGGNPALGLQLLDFLPSLEDPVAFCQISVTRSSTLTLVGRSVDGLADADRALALHAGFAEPLLLPHPSIHLANGAFALLQGGSPVEALRRAELGYGQAMADSVAVSLVWCQLVAGDACLLLGQGALALEHFEVALRDALRELFRGQVAIAWAGIAMSRARLGDAKGARVAMARSDAETSRIGSFDLNVCAARATVSVVSGEYGSACAELQRGATLAAAGGNVIGEAWMLHELARFGMAHGVGERIQSLADMCENALVRGRALHVSALVSNDPEALLDAGAALLACGAPVLAAEAALQASSSFARAGDERRANASALRSQELLQGTDTPLLIEAPTAATLTPLTAREREIAYLASEGISNKEISERLFLSLRTVENHLSRVFVKLGISSRQELRAVLSGHAGR